MKIDILTLFPGMFDGPFKESILKRAQEKKIINISINDLRKWTTDNHKTVDDRPFGGGVGMVMKVDVIDRAVYELKNSKTPKIQNSKQNKIEKIKVILLDAGGKPFNQKKAIQLSKANHLILISGHYEGVDYRVHQHIADEIVSIGDYILTGGEIPAMVLVDSIARLIPGVIVKSPGIENESFTKVENGKLRMVNSLEYPQYTRPVEYNGWKVPKVLLGGNHKEIDKWRKEKSLTKTKSVRPDFAK